LVYVTLTTYSASTRGLGRIFSARSATTLSSIFNHVFHHLCQQILLILAYPGHESTPKEVASIIGKIRSTDLSQTAQEARSPLLFAGPMAILGGSGGMAS
jgi:hypothetical protein